MEIDAKELVKRQIPNLVSAAVNTVAALGNEKLQDLVRKGQIEYMPFMGYMSDVAYPAAMISGILAFTNLVGEMDPQNKKLMDIMSKAAPFLLGSFLTVAEIAEKTHAFAGTALSNGGTYDPLDIACYWTGIALAYGVNKWQNSRNKVLESPVQPLKSIENMI